MLETKDKILDTAQRLIGDQGYAATSVRQIISEAGVNLASIHYHFGSKEDLLDALILRKAGPVNAERMARLERLESEAAGRPLTVKQALEAFLVPMAETADQNPTFVKLMGRMMAEGMLATIVQKHFHQVVERFGGVLRRSVPDLPEEEFRWRMHFMFGAMAQTMVFTVQRDVIGLSVDTADFGGRIDRLVTFLTAGFQAPATRSGAKQ